MNTVHDADWQRFMEAGLYTVPMAARLLAAQQNKVRSWVEGYTNSDARPIIQRQLPKVGGRTVLGFLDLIEAAFIRHFTALGYSPQTIRKLAEKLRERHHIDHPFAMGTRFRADGRAIFQEVIDDEGEQQILNLMNDNFCIGPVIEQSLFDQILYIDDIARQWQPIPQFPKIIVNPRFAFGRPIVDGAGVPSEVIFNDYLLAGDAQEVADEYELAVADINEAVGFELELNKRILH